MSFRMNRPGTIGRGDARRSRSPIDSCVTIRRLSSRTFGRSSSASRRAIEMSFLSAEADEVLHNIVECTEPRRMIKALSHHVHERRFRTKVALALTYCVERNAESNAFRGVAGRAALETAYAILNDCVQCGEKQARTFTRRCVSSLFHMSSHEEREKVMRYFPNLCEFAYDAD